MTSFSLPSRSSRKKFTCTVYSKEGKLLVKRVYTAYNEEGALMQLEEWLEAHAESDHDPDTIKIEPARDQ